MVIPLMFVVDIEDQLTFLKLKFIFLKGKKKKKSTIQSNVKLHSWGKFLRCGWHLGFGGWTLEPDSAQGVCQCSSLTNLFPLLWLSHFYGHCEDGIQVSTKIPWHKVWYLVNIQRIMNWKLNFCAAQFYKQNPIIVHK